MADYLHNDPDFKDLLAIVAEKEGIDSTLVEKDYWIMHVLHGLQQLGIEFELKGGTSLSKGYGLIERFSCKLPLFSDHRDLELLDLRSADYMGHSTWVIGH